MHEILESVRVLRNPVVAFTHLAPFAASLLIAEWLFKFGSFSLECMAFLALWWVLRRAIRAVGLAEGSEQ